MRYADGVSVHSDQAELFAERHESGGRDPYGDCFAYSRMRLWEQLGPELDKAAPGSRVLDVGCGTGHDVARLRRSGFEVSGIDGSPEMLAIARELNPENEFFQADVRSLPQGSASVDVVLSVEVLRYLPDPRPALAEMARVLRPGGLLLATALPVLNLNAYAVVNRLALRIDSERLTRVRQSFTWSPRLRRQVCESGFCSIGIHGVYLGPLNWIERIAPRALPGLLRRWHRLDSKLADAPIARDLSNMYLVVAERRPD